MKFALFFISVCVISIHGFGINIKYGELIIDGFEECEFENNGNNYTYKSYDENFRMNDKLLFGLINYKCDNNTGVLISKFECKPCGLFCNYNQSVARCKHIVLPYILGGIIGSVIGIIIYISSKYAFKCIKENLVLWCNYKMTKRNDNKHIKTVTEMKEITGTISNVNFKDIKNMKEQKLEKIKKNRENFKSTVLSNRRSLYPRLPTEVVVLIICGLLICSVFSCDNNLFVSSNGKICEKNKCKNLDMISFPLQTGQSICFRD